MSYKEVLTINDKVVVFCSCGTPADGLFRGQTLHPESSRPIAMNRYLCALCAQDNADLNLKTRRVKRLVYDKATWKTIERIYEEARNKGLELFSYFGEWESKQASEAEAVASG